MSEAHIKRAPNRNGERAGFVFFAFILAGIVWYFMGMPGWYSKGFNAETIVKVKKSIEEEFVKKRSKGSRSRDA